MASEPMSSGNHLGPSGSFSFTSEERVDVEALGGARDDDVVEVGELLGSLELGGHLVGLGKVGLGEHEDLGCAGAVDVTRDPLVARAHGLGGIDEHGHDVDVSELAQGGTVELLAKGCP